MMSSQTSNKLSWDGVHIHLATKLWISFTLFSSCKTFPWISNVLSCLLASERLIFVSLVLCIHWPDLAFPSRFIFFCISGRLYLSRIFKTGTASRLQERVHSVRLFLFDRSDGCMSGAMRLATPPATYSPVLSAQTGIEYQQETVGGRDHNNAIHI